MATQNTIKSLYRKMPNGTFVCEMHEGSIAVTTQPCTTSKLANEEAVRMLADVKVRNILETETRSPLPEIIKLLQTRLAGAMKALAMIEAVVDCYNYEENVFLFQTLPERIKAIIDESDQEAIGLLGSGANKGDGPGSRRNAAKQKRNEKQPARRKLEKKVEKRVAKKVERKVERKEARIERKIVARVQRDRPKVTTYDKRAPRSAPAENRQIMEKVVAGITDPLNFQIERFATAYTTDKTALANPWRIEDQGWATDTAPVDGALADVERTELPIFAFRHPQCANILYDANAAGKKMDYLINGRDNTTGTVQSQFDWSVGTDIRTACPLVYGEKSAATFPIIEQAAAHGSKWYAAKHPDDPDLRFFFMSRYQTALFYTELTVAGLSDVTLKVHVHYFGPEGLVNPELEQDLVYTASTTNVRSFDFEAGRSGYYAISATVSDSGAESLPIVFSTQFRIWTKPGATYDSTPIFRHLCLSDYEHNDSAALGIRVAAASMTMSNTAPELSKQGDCCGYQMPADSFWMNYLSFDAVSTKQGMTKLPNFNKGIHMFVRPSSVNDFKLSENVQVEGDVVVDSAWPLQSDMSGIVLIAKVEAQEGRSGKITCASSAEYTTGDVWRSVTSSRLSNNTYTNAVALLKDVAQVRENPSHLSSIWNSVKKAVSYAANGVLEYGPAAIEVASMFA